MNGNFATNQNEKNSFLNRFAINLNEAAASQFAVYHRGVAPVMMHMLRFLDFHRR